MKKKMMIATVAGVMALAPLMTTGSIASAAPSNTKVFVQYTCSQQQLPSLNLNVMLQNLFSSWKPVYNGCAQNQQNEQNQQDQQQSQQQQQGQQQSQQQQQDQQQQQNQQQTEQDQQQVQSNVSEYAVQVAELVNEERAKAGLAPLTLDAKLSEVAMLKAKDMYDNNYFDHQSPTYGSPFDMMRANGITYNTAGENIAKGQRTPEEVMNAWMNSEGHRKNILNSSFTKIGVAYYNGEWVQQFIG